MAESISYTWTLALESVRRVNIARILALIANLGELTMCGELAILGGKLLALLDHCWMVPSGEVEREFEHSWAENGINERVRSRPRFALG
jgi:hypothetical protein